MPLQATSGAASYDAFGGGVAAVPNYIEDVFSTYLYTGTGSAQTITNGIDLSTKGGLVWCKSRSSSISHGLSDTVTGRTKALRTNNFASQVTTNDSITSFNNNGFSLGTDLDTGWFNTNLDNYVSWTLRKQPKFFDVVTWTGSGSNRTIAHSLGSVPACIIVKRRDDDADWQVYHRSLANTEYLVLNTAAAKATGATRWNSTTPTSAVFSLGTDATVNASGGTYVAYLFAHDAGGFGLTGTDNVISCGSFTGSASGTTVNLGWEPQWVLIKRSSGNTDNWRIYDNMRGMTASNGGQLLYADTSGSETTNSRISVNATGFGFVDDAAYGNIYIAIRRGPMKVPTSGTSVYSVFADGASTNPKTFSAGFPTDFAISQVRSTGAGSYNYAGSRLTGNSQYLVPQTTGSEQADTTPIWTFDLQNSFKQNISAASMVSWLFRRAPSFFDVVCYTNNATGASVQVNTHNLGVRPELAITKVRNDVMDWFVGSNIGNTTFDGSFLNTTAAADIGRSYTSSSAYKGFTATTFSVGSSPVVGAGGLNVVTYLFATCAGVSKCGTFTGNGSSQTINCGFTGGARFVMIKATSTTGDWMVADSARGIVSGSDPYLELNNTNAEVTGEDWLDTDSTGFVVNEVSGSNANTNGVTYIFLAIA